MKRTVLCIIIPFILVAEPVIGQVRDAVKPVRTTKPPVIDGILDEEVWVNNQGISDFKSFIPDFCKELPFETIVWLAYD